MKTSVFSFATSEAQISFRVLSTMHNFQANGYEDPDDDDDKKDPIIIPPPKN